ncbi:MAG TPA: hypothetical protein VFO60_02605 [Candidatus Dormibacteraeota bacterium]|nr:hypothetical protein [Candidatus Dormibacteraeota bacterium]
MSAVAAVDAGPAATAGGRAWRAGSLVLPLLLTAGVMAAYLVDALAVHPGTPALNCPVGGVDRLVHWDGGWYDYIALHGYAPRPGTFQPGAFFPLLPGLADLGHLAVPFLSVEAAGIVVNLGAVAAAMCIVDRLVADWPPAHRAALVAVLLSVPGAMFYATFYSEALFVLGVAVAMWALLTPGRLAAAPAGIAVASAARIIGIALVVPLVLALRRARDRVGAGPALALLALAFAGVVGVEAFAAISTGDPGVIIRGRATWHGASGNGYLPYLAKHGADTVRLAWDFATFSPAPGLSPEITAGTLPSALGVYLDVLLVPLVVAAWRASRDLGILAAVMAAATVAGGSPLSQMRYVAVIVPAWMGFVALARGRRAGWVAIALVVAGGVALNLHLMADFANCAWAG